MNPYPNPYGLPQHYPRPMMPGSIMSGAVLSGIFKLRFSLNPYSFLSTSNAPSLHATHATHASDATQWYAIPTHGCHGTKRNSSPNDDSKWDAPSPSSKWSSPTDGGTKHHSIDLCSTKLATTVRIIVRMPLIICGHSLVTPASQPLILYIGSIPPELDNAFLLQLLEVIILFLFSHSLTRSQTCGQVHKWNRPEDLAGRTLKVSPLAFPLLLHHDLSSLSLGFWFCDIHSRNECSKVGDPIVRVVLTIRLLYSGQVSECPPWAAHLWRYSSSESWNKRAGDIGRSCCCELLLCFYLS
jgi:hypothetical protein